MYRANCTLHIQGFDNGIFNPLKLDYMANHRCYIQKLHCITAEGPNIWSNKVLKGKWHNVITMKQSATFTLLSYFYIHKINKHSLECTALHSNTCSTLTILIKSQNIHRKSSITPRSHANYIYTGRLLYIWHISKHFKHPLSFNSEFSWINSVDFVILHYFASNCFQWCKLWPIIEITIPVTHLWL